MSAGSPLGCVVAAALAGQAGILFQDDAPPAKGRWRRAVAGTALQWWTPTRPAEQPAAVSGADGPAADVGVELHGPAPAGPGRRWRLVDGSGVPLLAAFHALQSCHHSPFTASLFLIAEAGATGQWQVLAEAHLSSSVHYPALLDALGRAGGHLLRTALRSGGHGRPWDSAPPARPRTMPLARSRAAAAAAWLRARAGGDLYGIAVMEGTGASLLQDAVVSPPGWMEIPARQGFIADPFFHPGRPGVVLCERYTHASGRGHLAAVPASPATRGVAATPALVADHHLSYPFTMADGGRTVCLPEMAAARRQVLYELRDGQPMSPLCIVAEDVAMADPTLMRWDGLYWLSYTDADIGPYDNLCLMFAERLTGPWRRHPGNPVKVDVRSSRPGGTPFRVHGRWYRPAQDCSKTYGGALVINEIRTCTTERYDEAPVAALRPDPSGRFPDGLHTLALDGSRMLVDGKRISYHPAIAWNKVRRRLLPS